MEKIKLNQFADYLKPRPRDCHKGQFGHVLIVGGEAGFSGAVCLAAEAALRVGAGLVRVATRAEHAFILNAARPEIMCHVALPGKKLDALFSKATVIVIGPGIGQTMWAEKLVEHALKSKKPLIVDADALNILTHDGRWLKYFNYLIKCLHSTANM